MNDNEIQSLKLSNQKLILERDSLRQQNIRLHNEARVMGNWECPRCRLVLTKNALHVGTGTVGVDDSPFNTICLNCGTAMQPLTLASAYLSLCQNTEAIIKRFVRARNDLDKIKGICAQLQKPLEKLHHHNSEKCEVVFIQDGKALTDMVTDLGEAYGESEMHNEAAQALFAYSIFLASVPPEPKQPENAANEDPS